MRTCSSQSGRRPVAIGRQALQREEVHVRPVGRMTCTAGGPAVVAKMDRVPHWVPNPTPTPPPNNNPPPQHTPQPLTLNTPQPQGPPNATGDHHAQPAELKGQGHLVAAQHPHRLSRAKSSSCAMPGGCPQQPRAHTRAATPPATWGGRTCRGELPGTPTRTASAAPSGITSACCMTPGAPT